MKITFETMPGRTVLGGNEQLSDPVTRQHTRNSNSHGRAIPLNFLRLLFPIDPPLPRSKFAQAVIDVFALVFGRCSFVRSRPVFRSRSSFFSFVNSKYRVTFAVSAASEMKVSSSLSLVPFSMNSRMPTWSL
jgi:hypothetical protein